MEYKKALQEIETGKPFNLEWCTLNVRKGTGGEVRRLDGLRLVQKEQEGGGQKANKKDQKAYSYAYDQSKQWINLYHEEDGRGRYIKVYKRLMLAFNGQEITY